MPRRDATARLQRRPNGDAPAARSAAGQRGEGNGAISRSGDRRPLVPYVPAGRGGRRVVGEGRGGVIYGVA